MALEGGEEVRSAHLHQLQHNQCMRKVTAIRRQLSWQQIGDNVEDQFGPLCFAIDKGQRCTPNRKVYTCAWRFTSRLPHSRHCSPKQGYFPTSAPQA